MVHMAHWFYGKLQRVLHKVIKLIVLTIFQFAIGYDVVHKLLVFLKHLTNKTV